jgi:uncharacterized protein YkwD
VSQPETPWHPVVKKGRTTVEVKSMELARLGLIAISCFAFASCSGGGGGNSPPDGGVSNASPTVLAMEEATHALINAERQLQALPGLVHDNALRVVARQHSEDMVTRSFFSHANPDGLDPFDRLANAGVTYVTAGENIAWNLGYVDPAVTAVTGWMNSAGHRANILHNQFTLTGLGAAQGENGAWFFTQVFTRPTGSLVLQSWWQREESTSDVDQGASSWAAEQN